MTDRWRPPINEALDMADAFREGVPLGWQRAFVALADAYRDVVAERDIMTEQVVVLSADIERRARQAAAGSAYRGRLGQQFIPTPETVNVDYFMAAAFPSSDTAVRVNDWPAPDNDAGPDWTYPPLPDIDTAQEDRRARRALMIACALALAVAGVVHFLG